MYDVSYEELPVIWERKEGPDWAEIEEAVIEAIAEEVETCAYSD